MKKEEIIIKILYVLALISFLGSLITKKTYFMFCGGVILTAASTMLIIYNKKQK